MSDTRYRVSKNVFDNMLRRSFGDTEILDPVSPSKTFKFHYIKSYYLRLWFMAIFNSIV